MRSRGDCLKCIRENTMPQHESHLYDVITTRDRIVLVILSLFHAYTVYNSRAFNDFQIQGPTGEGDNNIPYNLHFYTQHWSKWAKKEFYFFFPLYLSISVGLCMCWLQGDNDIIAEFINGHGHFFQMINAIDLCAPKKILCNDHVWTIWPVKWFGCFSR